jgi:protein CpxP
MRTSMASIVSAVVLTAAAGAISIDILPAFGQGVPPAATQEQQRPLPGERIEARLAYLKTALKITPAQEQQWSAVADVLRRHARERDAEIQQRRAARQAQRQNQTPGQPPQRQQQTAIERLQQQQQRLATASTRMNELVAAAQPLYASFNDDQKKIADEMLTRGGRRFGRGGWR